MSFRLAPSLESALGGGVVRVGTENAAKLSAVRSALSGFVASERSELRIVGVAVQSGVPEQPLGWGEIVSGARHRAEAALASGEAALAVGIEDGLVQLGAGVSTEGLEDHYNMGCAWITDGHREGHGFSSGFAYPPACLEPAVREQAPIGDLFDAYWARHRSPEGRAAEAPSGRGEGNIGRLTGGQLARAAYGAQAVVCALIRFLHTDLYA